MKISKAKLRQIIKEEMEEGDNSTFRLGSNPGLGDTRYVIPQDRADRAATWVEIKLKELGDLDAVLAMAKEDPNIGEHMMFAIQTDVEKRSAGNHGELEELQERKISKSVLYKIIKEELGTLREQDPAEENYVNLANAVGDLVREALEGHGLDADSIRDAIAEALDEELGPVADEVPRVTSTGPWAPEK